MRWIRAQWWRRPRDEVWEAPTGTGHWQVPDVVGTTEAYFVAVDAARSASDVDPAYGLPGMAARVDQEALALRDQPRPAPRGSAARRLRQDHGDVRRAHRYLNLFFRI